MKQLDRIEQMLKYLIITPKMEWLENHFRNHQQVSSQTFRPPLSDDMTKEYKELQKSLPDIDKLIKKSNSNESNT